MTVQLTGRLEAVDPRRIWATEEGDFIPWLSEAGNLQLLGNAIGLDLEIGKSHGRIGSGGAGLTCRDTKGDLVVIENQLDPTDHQRLGQLLTHTAAFKAATTVWIASSFSDEHKEAVDRLNQMTTKRFSFFGVEIEAWKIQDSPPAPRFLLVSKPRSRSRGATGDSSPARSDVAQDHAEFWREFHAFAKAQGSTLIADGPETESWTGAAASSGNFALRAKFSGRELRAELHIDVVQAKNCLIRLRAEPGLIDGAMGESLEWDWRPGATRCRIYLRRKAILDERRSWAAYHGWLIRCLGLLDEASSGRLLGPPTPPVVRLRYRRTRPAGRPFMVAGAVDRGPSGYGRVPTRRQRPARNGAGQVSLISAET